MARSNIGSESKKTGGTKIQKMLQEKIKNLGFGVEHEYPFPPYQVDCYVPEAHIAFEADGLGHMAKSDAQRDNTLGLQYGLIVVRFTQKQIEAGIEDDQIISRIEDAMEDKKDRMGVWLG